MIIYVCYVAVHNLSFALLLHMSENSSITDCEDCGYDKNLHSSLHSISFSSFHILLIFFGFDSTLRMDMFGLSYVPSISLPWPCRGSPPRWVRWWAQSALYNPPTSPALTGRRQWLPEPPVHPRRGKHTHAIARHVLQCQKQQNSKPKR